MIATIGKARADDRGGGGYRTGVSSSPHTQR